MKQCQKDHSSLRNKVSDVQAIIATLEKQGEVANGANVMSVIPDALFESMCDKIARKK